MKQPKLGEMDQTLGIALATSRESEDPVADSSHLERTLLWFPLSHCELTIVWHCDNGLLEKKCSTDFLKGQRPFSNSDLVLSVL